jgi:hypothetical protein
VRLLASLLAAAALAAAAGETAGAAEPGVPALFSGERLDYDVSFLFWGRAAVGRISLEPEPPGVAPDGLGLPGSGRYLARLSAETKGFVGWVNRRRHVYSSILVPCDGARRWCSRVFVKDLTERGHREVTTTFINHARGALTWLIRRGDDERIDEIGHEPIPPGARYDDMLAALFNFRAGVYGPAEKGRRYELDMMPVGGVRRFTLRVLAGEEEAAARRRLELGKGGVVIAVRLPRAIFDAEGEVLVWLSPDMVPLSATVQNYIGLGDVTGRIVHAARPAGAPPVAVDRIEAERRQMRRSESPPGVDPSPER